jgi:putative glycosyltransferase (TIGR04372 family)
VIKRVIKEILGRLFLAALHAASLFKPIRFCRVYSDRLGHLCLAELFFRKRNAGLLDKYCLRIFWHYSEKTDQPANRQIFAMISRVEPVRRSRWLYRLTALRCLKNSRFVEHTPRIPWEYRGFEHLPPGLSFTPQEIERGRRKLAQMGLGPDDWSVCFHNRDSSYLNKTYPGSDWTYHDHRDHSVGNMTPAMRYVAEKGGFVFRMGAAVAEPLRAKHSRIIDYATNFRSDFMDVFLMSRCRYAVCGDSGLYVAAMAFNVPVAAVNFVPTRTLSRLPFKTVIPKRLHWRDSGAELNLEEIEKIGAGRFKHHQDYDKAGVELRENSPEEILALTEEMNALVEGTISFTAQDDRRQADYFKRLGSKEIFRPGHPRIGREFLDKRTQETRAGDGALG